MQRGSTITSSKNLAVYRGFPSDSRTLASLNDAKRNGNVDGSAACSDVLDQQKGDGGAVFRRHIRLGPHVRLALSLNLQNSLRHHSSTYVTRCRAAVTALPRTEQVYSHICSRSDWFLSARLPAPLAGICFLYSTSVRFQSALPCNLIIRATFNRIKANGCLLSSEPTGNGIAASPPRNKFVM